MYEEAGKKVIDLMYEKYTLIDEIITLKKEKLDMRSKMRGMFYDIKDLIDSVHEARRIIRFSLRNMEEYDLKVKENLEFAAEDLNGNCPSLEKLKEWEQNCIGYESDN